MAIKNVDIKEFKGFSKRLATLARMHDLGRPEDLAEALYNNKKCHSLVKPRERKNKDGIIIKNAIKAKAAITRTIQYHYEEENAYRIQSSFMYAYSILFDCSLDYLYGKTDIITSNQDVADICNKTGLSENAVITLMNSRNHEITGNCSLSYSAWWSEYIQDDCFKKLPEIWLKYANLVLESKVAINPPRSETSAEDILAQLKVFPNILKILSNEEILEGFYSHEKGIEYQVVEDAKLGAYYKMVLYIEDLLSKHADKWAEIQYPFYYDKQLRSDFDSLKMLIKNISDLNKD